MNDPSTTIPPTAVEALRRTVAGLVVYPSDPSYPSLVPPSGPGSVSTPGVVVVPETEAAVRAAVDVARLHGLDVASDVCGSVTDGGMLVLTHVLDELVVDLQARTATLGAGTSWARLADALDGSGLTLVPAGPPDSGVIDSVVAGLAPVLWARVVRLDGFVHVVADVAPPAADRGPWVITAVVVPLTHVTSPVSPTSHLNQEVPS